MIKPIPGAQVVTLPQITRAINKENLDNEILVFDVEKFIGANEILPLRIDALLIGICTAGEGKIGIDLNEYEIHRNSFILLSHNNFLSTAEISEDFKCSVMVCSKHIVEDVLPTLIDILPLFLHHRIAPVNSLTHEEADSILRYFDFIKTSINGEASKFHKKKVLYIFQSMLYELLDIRIRYARKIKKMRSRKEEIMARFLINVAKDFRSHREVAYYADQLNITPKHLSTMVKEISGRPAGDWIEHYVIMEAKILLKTTDMTIQQISDYLNFANQSFFGKYFKHATGFSPSDYRSKI